MFAYNLVNHYLSPKPFKKYLEIGLHRGYTFMNVSADIKHSVDPDSEFNATHVMTSDAFFDNVAPHMGIKYDVIFIDGLHHTEQVDKDIENSLKYLQNDGVIILHDCNPISEMRQRVPADFDIWAHGWNGDVWKSIFKFRKNNSHLNYKVFVVNDHEGLGVIKPNEIGTQLVLNTPIELNYQFFETNRNEILNLISTDEFYNNINLY